MRILVVDDEALLVKGICYNLRNEGYEVLTGSNGLDAVRTVRETPVDLVILDVMMPEMDGLEACRQIRDFSDVPIILLTAKADDMDKLMGFEHGADDYLTKPFNILELKARVRALLRRAGLREAKPEQIEAGAIRLDLVSRNAYRDGVLADLTAKEFDLVDLLIRNPNRVYSRENLLGGRAYPPHPREAGAQSRRARAHHDKVGSWLLFQGVTERGASRCEIRSCDTRSFT